MASAPESTSFLSWFWNPVFWLAPGLQWKDFGPAYPDISDLIVYPIPIAIGILLLRLFLDRIAIRPLGRVLGVSNKHNALPANIPLLESTYKSCLRPTDLSHKLIQSLAAQLAMPVRKVERWFRKRVNQEKPTQLTKFTETSWRFVCYSASFGLGIYILQDKPWLSWDIRDCWTNYPAQDIPADVWWYCILSSSLYWSFVFSQFSDVRRKDFWQMFVHHLATIGLILFSWIVNFVRVGTLIILLHDCADVVLELTKAAKYAGMQRTAEILFVLLTLVWILTRLGVYPYFIVTSLLFQVPASPMVYYMGYVMIFTLLILHVFWTNILLTIIFKTLSTGRLDKDGRSETDELTLSESDTDTDASSSNDRDRDDDDDDIKTSTKMTKNSGPTTATSRSAKHQKVN